MDPRKRLQVLNSNNPSLRVSVAPQPRLTVASPQPQQNQQPRVYVQDNGLRSSTPAPAPQPKKSFINKVGGAVFGNTAKFANTVGAGARGVYDLADIGRESIFGTDEGYARKVNEADQRATNMLEPNRGIFGKGTFFKNREEAQNISAGDLTKKIVGGGLGTASEVVPFARAGQLVKQGGKLVLGGTKFALPKFTKTAIKAGAEGAGYGAVGSAGSQLADEGKINTKETALSALVGAGTGAGTFSVGRGIFKLRGGEKGAAGRIITKLAGEQSSGKIAKMLETAIPGADKELISSTAEYIAKEDSKQAIEAILKNIEVDPRIKLSDADKQRLQDEGVKKVEIGDTPYGADYGDGSIRFNSPEDATPDKIYHEVGHAIWKNKLTPEERAAFAKVQGSASKRAAGREGYTADDIASEDFADYTRKAIEGRINEVPEELRAIVAKYAKVTADNVEAQAKNIPDTTIHLPKQGIYAKLNKSQAYHFKDEINNVKSSAEDIVHLSATDAALRKKAKEVSLDEIKAASRNAQETLDNIPGNKAVKDAADIAAPSKPVSAVDEATQAAEQISSKTAGTSFDDAVKELSGKETTQEDVNKVFAALGDAQTAYDTKSVKVSQQKGQRAAAAEDAYWAAGGGEAGRIAKMKTLGGEYAKSDYKPISVEPEVRDRFMNDIARSDLQGWEKTNTQNALAKIFGERPETPANHDIQYIKRFFNDHYGEGTGDELAAALQEAAKTGEDNIFVNIAGLPRALMATGDLSGGFRQAAPLGTRYPKLWANANIESVKYAVKPEYYRQEMKKIADAPDYNVVADKMGVDLTGVGAMQDEGFIGAGLAEKIPVANIGIKAADRAYTGVITRLRYDVAHSLVEAAGGPEQYVKNMENIFGSETGKVGLIGSKTAQKADRAMRALGEVINTFTGRGGMKGGLLDKHMATLSTTLFAPRLWAANVNRLNPIWYARLARDNPAAAKLALQSQSTFLATAGVVLSLAAAAGAEVGQDMLSADFGKIKIGNTRYDILGGQQQNIVQAARQWTGKKVDSTTGEVDVLGDGYGAKTRFDLLFDMAVNKSNPLLGFAYKMGNTSPGDNIITRKDKYGNDLNIGVEVAKLGTPLGIQGAIGTSKDVGSPVKGTLMNIPSFFGVGVQTYGSEKTKDQKAGATPKFSTDLEGRAKEAEKNSKQRTKDAKATLSKEDAAIYKIGNADPESLSGEEKAKYDQIKKYLSDYGKGPKKEEGVTSDVAKNFYDKYNSMTEKDQEYWLKEAPDDNSKKVATLLNKERTKGLSEFKPSNELTKAYAQYEKDINTHPEYTEMDKRKKAREFQKYAYKLNYSDSQRDIYTQSIDDIRYAIEEGQVTKEDLSEAIKMDNELYESGLISDPKFSNKFRRDHGYGAVAGGGSGSGSGSGDSTPRTGITKLLPSFRSGSAGSAPQFSTKPRTKNSISTPSLPGRGNKRVNINL